MYFIASDLKKIKPEVVALAVSLFFAVSCLLLHWLLPMEASGGNGDVIEVAIRLVVILVLFPIIYVRIILRKSFADMYIGRFQFQFKTIFYLILSFIIGLLGIFVITQSFLGDYYSKLTLTKYIASNFWIFIFYECLFVPVLMFIFVFFAFGFVNLITEKFNKLNLILPIIFYYLLITFPSVNVLEDSLISLISILPVIFFRKIVNINKNIWSLFGMLLILNIIFNTVIIKLLS